MRMNLQFFGGRGAGSGGEGLADSSGKPINIKDTTDVWAYRHNKNNEPFVDSINGSVRDLNDEFPGIMSDTVNEVVAAELGGKDRTSTLGYFAEDSGTVALNRGYTNIDKMNTMYDSAGDYHPGRGNKNAVEAVTYHEMGHALTANIGQKMGTDLDGAAKSIVNNAYKATKGTGGTKAWARKISGYAAESYGECVAEAVADYFCNGSKAKAQSKAIITEMKKYNKL